MRVLLVSATPLAAEAGAAQLVLSLEAGLRARGVEALAWEIPVPPPGLSSGRRRRWQERELEAKLATEPGFDAVDLPPLLCRRRFRRYARLIARTVQPDWLYYRAELAELRRRPNARLLAHRLLALGAQARVLAGFGAADVVLCLGSLEALWVRRHWPWLGGKLISYDAAPTPDEQARLAEVRGRRKPAEGGIRWLWIGRWAAHKGTARLLAFLPGWLAARPTDTVTLAGCGPGLERELAPELLAAGRVELVPAYSRVELPGLLERHHAGLFTSVAEGWGLSLSEMLESGMPVWATRAGGVPDLEAYFPGALLPFPPPLALQAGELPRVEPAPGYFERFSWGAIAARYELEVLLALASRSRR
ncbi:MAG: glycosyltransferase family 4 protein [Thermoanaerobaculia bacterium]